MLRLFLVDILFVFGVGGWMLIVCLFVILGIGYSIGEIIVGFGERLEVLECLGFLIGFWGEGGERYLLVEGFFVFFVLLLEFFFESFMFILFDVVIFIGFCLIGIVWFGEVRNGFVVFLFGDVIVVIFWWWCCCGL